MQYKPNLNQLIQSKQYNEYKILYKKIKYTEYKILQLNFAGGMTSFSGSCDFLYIEKRDVKLWL